MTQRVLIAMALSSHPRLLIADEPTSGLDVTIQAQFLDQMWEATQATGSAVLLVTQNLGIVANYCDRVVVMADGAIVESAPVREFFDAPQNEYSRKVLSLQRAAQGNDPAAPMARSVDVPAGAPLVSVRDLSKDFDIRGSKAKVHAVDHGVVRHPSARMPRSCRRKRFRQDDGRPLPVAARDTDRGRDLLRRDTAARVSDDELRRLRTKLQIVFQDPFDSMNPRWSVADIIGEMLDLHTGCVAQQKAARIDELLTLVGLEPVDQERLSAPAQRRTPAAHRNRTRDRDRSGFHRARRADLRADPGDDGRDHPSADGPLEAARPCLSLHLARPHDRARTSATRSP